MDNLEKLLKNLQALDLENVFVILHYVSAFNFEDVVRTIGTDNVCTQLFPENQGTFTSVETVTNFTQLTI